MLPNLLLTHSDEITGVIHVGAHLGQELKYYKKYNFEKILLFDNLIFMKTNKKQRFI